MPTDETNEQALQKLQEQYGDQIEKYEYKYWREKYISSPPKNSFCSGMARYRNCSKVSYIILKNGDRIPVKDGLFSRIIGAFIKY
jgi:hypothetical protein